MEAVAPLPHQSLKRTEQQAQERLDEERVHSFNPDFLMALMLAIPTDVLDIINLTGVGKIITIIIDILIFLIMFLWMHWRASRLENAKEDARQILQAYTEGGGGKAAKAVRATRFITRTGVTRRAVIKALKRTGLVAVAEIIPFVGLLPFWSILVVLQLRERAHVADVATEQ